MPPLAMELALLTILFLMILSPLYVVFARGGAFLRELLWTIVAAGVFNVLVALYQRMRGTTLWLDWLVRALNLLFITLGIFFTGGVSFNPFTVGYVTYVIIASVRRGMKGAWQGFAFVSFSIIALLFVSPQPLQSQDLFWGMTLWGVLLMVAIFSGLANQERLKSQRALQDSERKFHSLFEASPDAVSLNVLKSGKYLEVNDAFCRLSGYSREEILGRTPRELRLWHNWRRDGKRFLRELMQRGQVENFQAEFVRRDGAVRTGLISARLVSFGRQPCVIAVTKDVTELRRLEEQLRHAQKMEAIGTLAGGIAHDFNNILTGILGFASFIKQQMAPDDPLRPDVDIIIRSAQRAADLTYRLLTFARSDQYQVQAVNLNDVVREVVQLLSRTIIPSITIETHLEPGLRPVYGDPSQLQQMLLNLCLNARDAMPQGGCLTITTANFSLSPAEAAQMSDLEAGDYVLLEVTDTGVGMDKATQERVFEPFFTTKEFGRGLGLAMVHGIVRRHQGSIQISSEPGQGTEVRVYLPAGEAWSHRVMKSEKAVPGGAETILIVDDEEVVCNLLEQILQQAGYTVLQARSGEEAVRVYQEQGDKVDLVILDVVMPRLGGKPTLERLRRINPAVRIMISSGYGDEEQAREMLAAGVQGFLHKPYEAKTVLRMVREALEGKCIRDEGLGMEMVDR